MRRIALGHEAVWLYPRDVEQAAVSTGAMSRLRHPPRRKLAADVRPRSPVVIQVIRLAFIEGARERPEILATRLRHFVRKTAANERYGQVQG